MKSTTWVRRLSLATAWVLLAAANAPAADTPDSEIFSSELRPSLERYAADLHSLNRTYPIRLSPTRRARFDKFFAEQETALSSFDFDALSPDGRIDYILLKNQLAHERRRLQSDAAEVAALEPLIPFFKAIIGLEEARRRMEAVNSKVTATLLANMLHAIADARKTNNGKVDPALANRASTFLASLRRDLKGWYNFYEGYDPLFTWWVAEPYKQVDQALDAYSRFLREGASGIRLDDPEAIPGDPVGRDALMEELSYQMIPYTPEELIAIAKKDYAWSEAEMIRASRELKYGDDWHQALEYVKNDYVDPGKQPELVRRLAEEAIDYVTKHDLVTIPPLAREDWWEEMLSPQRQLTSPFFLGGDHILVAFPTNTMTQEQKLMSLRGNNIHFARATVFHELIPGHHLQGFMADRYRTYRAPFATPFWTEGDAFYWEMLLWDMGFAQTPEDRIGMLFWRMHRSARIIFSLSYHMKHMTAQECVDFLVDKVGFERENALAEVRRSFDGSYEPIYQCAYMLGALQFYALHKELVDSGKMTNRAFHDAILKENRIPVEMIRADLTNQKLTRDFKTNWRFYNLAP
ncbi:MAG: DUF885 family protein [Bryobacteraceae bacterium]